MNNESSTPEDNSPRTLLRHADQLGVGVTVAASLVIICGYCLGNFGRQQNFLEVEKYKQPDVKFWVDINTAEWPELMQLPMVGEETARKIVRWREENGRFTDHEDVLKVPGIGPKTFQTIQPYFQPMPKTDSVAGS